MTEKNRIIVLTGEQFLYENLKFGLIPFIAEQAASIEELNNLLVKTDLIAAVVIHLKDSNDWIALEILKTGYSGIPRFAILKNAQTERKNSLTADYGVSAVFSEENTGALTTLIQTSANNIFASPDRNKIFLRYLAGISAELQRLQGEFTVTAFRTLPQHTIAGDTEERLGQTLKNLEAIKIVP